MDREKLTLAVLGALPSNGDAERYANNVNLVVDALIKRKPETFLECLLQEQMELADKTSKLENFIDEGGHEALDAVSAELLMNQLRIMREYLAVLGLRVERITKGGK